MSRLLATPQEVERFFFEAMLQGWAGGGKSQEVPGFPGFKMYEHRKDDLRLVDTFWTSSPSPSSAGTTTIWQGDQVIWQMRYWGQYPKSVMPFLKETLALTYQADVFLGGRGQTTRTSGELLYHNFVHTNHFENFDGMEEIYDKGRLAGSHYYNGNFIAI